MKHFCFLTGVYGRRDPLMVERQGWSLVRAGFKVSYVVCDEEPDEEYEGINIISTGFKPRGRMQRFMHSKQYIYSKAIEIDADIYQISDPELINFGRKLKKKGKHVIFNIREYYPDLILKKQYMPKLIRILMSKYYSWSMNCYLNDYAAVFTITTELVDLLKVKHGINRVYLLPNYPIPDMSYRLDEEDYLKRSNTLFYEGSIYAVSRQEKVFDALTKIEDLNYLMVGKIEQGYEIIKEHPYWRKVHFQDGFKKEELKGFFASATISNTLRDFGKLDGSLGVIKLFESMEAALPVLVSDVPLYRKLIEKYDCGICVNPNNTNDIKSALEFLVKNKERAYQMGQNGRKAVLEEYNWPKQASLYINTINKILEV